MALFYECMLQYARKLLDTADIVREAMLRSTIGVKRASKPLRWVWFRAVGEALTMKKIRIPLRAMPSQFETSCVI